MPSAGIQRMATANLTLQKKKGKALTKAVGQAFAPKETLRLNREVGRSKPSAGLKIGGRK